MNNASLLDILSDLPPFWLPAPVIYLFAPGEVLVARHFVQVLPGEPEGVGELVIGIVGSIAPNEIALTAAALIARLSLLPPERLANPAFVATLQGLQEILGVSQLFDARTDTRYVGLNWTLKSTLPAIPVLVDPFSGLLVYGHNAGTPGVLSLSAFLDLLRGLPVEQQDAVLQFQFGSQALSVDTWRQYPANSASLAKATVLLTSAVGIFAGHYTPRTLAARLGPTEAANGDGPVLFRTQAGDVSVEGLRFKAATPNNPFSFPAVLLTTIPVLPSGAAGGPPPPTPPPFVDP